MIHDLIIWPKASDYRERIVQDIRSEFRIIAIIAIDWDKYKGYDNFKVFYSKSWRHLNLSAQHRAIKHKMEHCGVGRFTVVVFEDIAPSLSLAETTEGKRKVNINVFSKKKLFRDITGGGHMIHTSNDEQETDRDLCLLLGMGTEDFLRAYDSGKELTFQLSRNCTGIGGYDSLDSLFYTLNHTIEYCVLRNFDSIPDSVLEQGHEDIDLMTEDLSHIVSLTLARPISGTENRVDYSINVAGMDIPFDFRYVGDNYYDFVWEKHILDNRRLEKDLFYIPAPEDLYYSLLYHAFVQKFEVKPDYHPKLEHYACSIEVIYSSDPKEAIRQLDSFMARKGFEYVIPTDETVIYNKHNLGLSHYALRNGRCIKHTEETGQNGYCYTSKVFEEDDNIIKCGTSWLLENEDSFLGLLTEYDSFPHILSKTTLENGQVSLTLKRMEGVGADVFFKNVSNQRSRSIHSFVRQILRIIRILRSHGIEHRDMMPSNIIVSKDSGSVKVGLIDFGWAAFINDEKAKNPVHLGGRYAYNDNHSDCYALGVFLMDYWPDLPFVRLIASRLFKAAKGNTDLLLRCVNTLSLFPMGPYAWFRLLLRRHQRIIWTWHKLFK